MIEFLVIYSILSYLFMAGFVYAAWSDDSIDVYFIAGAAFLLAPASAIFFIGLGLHASIIRD